MKKPLTDRELRDNLNKIKEMRDDRKANAIKISEGQVYAINPKELRYGNYICRKSGEVIVVNFQTFSEIHEAERRMIPHVFERILMNQYFEALFLWNLRYSKMNTDIYKSFNPKYLHDAQNLYFVLTKEDLFIDKDTIFKFKNRNDK